MLIHLGNAIEDDINRFVEDVRLEWNGDMERYKNRNFKFYSGEIGIKKVYKGSYDAEELGSGGTRNSDHVVLIPDVYPFGGNRKRLLSDDGSVRFEMSSQFICPTTLEKKRNTDLSPSERSALRMYIYAYAMTDMFENEDFLSNINKLCGITAIEAGPAIPQSPSAIEGLDIDLQDLRNIKSVTLNFTSFIE